MSLKHIAGPDDWILVTGSSGFIGAKVVETLLEYGFPKLRCFVRPSSRLERLEKVLRRFDKGRNVELIAGDLVSREDCQKAARGVSIVYHLAAGIEKSFAGAFMNSALATRNLIDAFLEFGQPKRFVNVSSVAVYSDLNSNRGALLDETCPLEDAPQERYDAYGFGKLKQEELVKEYGTQHKLPYVILRPGAVFGPGRRHLSGRVGIDTFGFFIHVGGSSTEFLKAYKKRVKPFFSISVPYVLAYGMCLLWEKYSKWSKGQLPPVFNRRRCSAEWKGSRFSNQKLHDRLEWKPKVNMEEAMAAFLSQFESNGKDRGQMSEVRDQRSEIRLRPIGT